MVTRCEIAGGSALGCPPDGYVTSKMYFYIHDFEGYEVPRGDYFETTAISTHQGRYSWYLKVYPHGRMPACTNPDNQNDEAGIDHVAIYLALQQPCGPVAATFSLRTGNMVRFEKQKTPLDFGGSKGWGCSRFAERSELIDDFCDKFGTLVVEVEVEVDKAPVWYPPTCGDTDLAMELYRCVLSPADVLFVVGPTEKEVKAHSNVLKLRAEDLYELAVTESESLEHNDGTIRVRLAEEKDVSAFETMIGFVYTCQHPKLEHEESATTVLRVADRYGCTQLKLFAESVLVDRFVVASNTASLLLLADSLSCALLKEACMDSYALDATGVVASDEEWSKIEESPRILRELLFYTNVDKHNRCTGGRAANCDNLTVTALRIHLQSRKLDVDGSRETLVQRLKASLTAGCHKQDSN